MFLTRKRKRIALTSLPNFVPKFLFVLFFLNGRTDANMLTILSSFHGIVY